MPRRKLASDDVLRNLVDGFVSQVLALAESRVMDRIAAALGEAAGPSSVRARRSAQKPRPVTRPVAKAKVTRTCPVPGCGKPGRGPRFRWLCDEHKGMSRAAWLALKEGKAAKAAPKRATKAKAAAVSTATPAKAAPAKAAARKAAAKAAPAKAAPKKAAPRKAAPVKAAAKGNGQRAAAKPAPAPVRKTVAPPPVTTQRKTAAPPAA